jgi:hypothetical protein
MVEGTVTPLLLERSVRGSTDARREAAGGRLPTADEVAAAVVRAALDPELKSGATVVIGGPLEGLL